ncbi:hypothetical protein CRG98_023569 [Punica granatum]|uniref:Uncharacterized protein n=1 Tax=Punica granatum TaxID=22663 RepID=A0A2I0JIE3_PUNGR|nr:hypothetical protein CRG98_023569 [Punica granatum]
MAGFLGGSELNGANGDGKGRAGGAARGQQRSLWKCGGHGGGRGGLYCPVSAGVCLGRPFPFLVFPPK